MDRPGYGGSDPVKDGFATIGLAADDAAAVLADVLPAGATAGVAGWSAGGRVALALAARHPELVGRVGVIAAPAPDEEVPWYGDENRAMVDALRGLPPADVTARLAPVFEGMLAGAGDEALLGLAGVADADTDVLTAPVRERLRAMLGAATAQGVTGMVADLAGYTLADWGFTPAQVAADVLLATAPTTRWSHPRTASGIGSRLPSAELAVWAGVGHLVVVPAWGRMLEHLVPRT